MAISRKRHRRPSPKAKGCRLERNSHVQHDEIPRADKRLGKSRHVGVHNVDFTRDELEFMKAVDQYKREHRRPFPTCSEVLEILKSLGYRKQGKEEPNLHVAKISAEFPDVEKETRGNGD